MEAERRQVTVLFADMVGFTSFSERSGEEAAFTLMRSLWKLMVEAVREHGGVVKTTPGMALWRCSACQLHSRTRRCGPLARHFRSCNV